MSVAGVPLIAALFEAVHYKLVEPVFTIWLLSPYVCAGCLGAASAKNGKTMRGYCVLAFGAVPLFMLYVWGYCGVQDQMQHHAWTGATLWEAFLPFFGLPVALVGVLLGLIVSSLVSVLTGRKKTE